jgi:quercetin dioxygenase-like cupin family protein
MAISFNESTVAGESIGNGTTRQRLMTRERIPGTNILLDRLTLAAGGETVLAVAVGDIGWFQMLEGEAVLTLGTQQERLTPSHVAFLPPGARATLRTSKGASLIHATVPDAGRFDKTFTTTPPPFRAVDWRSEPVLDSQHDARQRIYLVTPKLFGTKVLKGEMIIYPKGTMAANHHHEGAEHFMYILRGRGTAWASEQPFAVRAGDVVYYHDLERHYLKADDDSELVFSEFFVPGEYTTIWVNDAEVCTWLPTGRTIDGAKPVREIKAHSSADMKSPADV